MAMVMTRFPQDSIRTTAKKDGGDYVIAAKGAPEAIAAATPRDQSLTSACELVASAITPGAASRH